MSGRHLDKIAAVCESGYDDLVEQMDATGKVHHAYTQARKRQVADAVAGERVRADRRIVCADCRSTLPTLAGATFDAVVTDPCFGLGIRYGGRKEEADNPADYWRFFGPVYRELLRVLKPGGILAVWQTAKWIPFLGSGTARTSGCSSPARVTSHFTTCKGLRRTSALESRTLTGSGGHPGTQAV